MVISNKLEEGTRAKRGLEVTRALELGYRALMPMSLERSVTQVGLTLDTPLPSQFAALRLEQRRISDQHFDALLTHLERSNEITNRQETINALKAARSNLAALRSRADTALASNRRDRASNAETLPQEIIAAVRGTQSILSNLMDSSSLRTAKAEYPVLAAYRTWRVREYEGQSRTFLAVALLHQRAMIPAEMKDSSELSGRAEASFEALTTMRRSLPEGALPTLDKVQQAYGQNYSSLRRSIGPAPNSTGHLAQP